MSVKEIITVPDEILAFNRSRESWKKRKKFNQNLFDTMNDAKGIGLAAIQIGVPKRIVVIDVSNKDKEKANMFN